MYVCTTAPADGAGSDAGRSRARLTAAEPKKEVAAREIEGLRARASDTAALAGESSGMRREEADEAEDENENQNKNENEDEDENRQEDEDKQEDEEENEEAEDEELR